MSEDDLLATLKRFNRKERYWVISNALSLSGPEYDPEGLPLSPQFVKDQLQKIAPIKEDAWWAVDYHLDWLVAALFHCFKRSEKPWQNKMERSWPNTKDNERWLVTGSQQDIDLLIVSGKHIVLVEAKAYGSWSNEQWRKKLHRLTMLWKEFADREERDKGDGNILGSRYQLHFATMSPDEPQKLDFSDVQSELPQWLADRKHIELKAPDKSGVLTVKRDETTNTFAVEEPA